MINEQIKNLRLSFIQENYGSLAKQAYDKQWTHIDYPEKLITGEA